MNNKEENIMKTILQDFQELFINIKPNERIRIIRKQRNLTIKQAAEICITTEKCWSDWENGKAIPRKSNRKPIALTLRVSVETIFGTPKACKL
jgi:transcriptional regulator with XRE-family HTH domain